MVPAQNILRRHCDSYGGDAYLSDGDASFHDPPRSSPLIPGESPMEDRELSPPADGEPLGSPRGSSEAGADAAPSAGRSGDWLRLGLASHPVAPTNRPPEHPRTAGEVELFYGGPSSSSPSLASPISWPGICGGFRAPAIAGVPWVGHRQEISWGTIWNPHFALGSCSTVIAPPQTLMPELVARQFTYPVISTAAPLAAGFWPDRRVVSSPRRPQSAVWFMLQAAHNQVREPLLPQIPKSYLRIKDGSMTVRLLMKYLVSKLELEDESEVEVTCRGQMLLPFFTLQDVRDNIWCSRETTTMTMAVDSPGVDRVMTLQYGRSAQRYRLIN